MNTKHTPGPWNYAHGSTDLLTHDGDDVAYVDTAIPERSKAEQQANARLISAAPDLLEALKEALDQLESWNQESEPTFTMRRVAHAIAKATGNTNL